VDAIPDFSSHDQKSVFGTVGGLKNALERLTGQTGDRRNRAVLVQDLYEAGFVELFERVNRLETASNRPVGAFLRAAIHSTPTRTIGTTPVLITEWDDFIKSPVSQVVPDVNTNRLTFTRSGVYMTNMSIIFEASSNRTYIALLRKNGVDYESSGNISTIGSEGGVTITDVSVFAAGEYVEALIQASATNADFNVQRGSFGAVLLGTGGGSG
jgi:hypothetical protein